MDAERRRRKREKAAQKKVGEFDVTAQIKSHVDKNGNLKGGPGRGEYVCYPTVYELLKIDKKAYLDCKIKCPGCGELASHCDWRRVKTPETFRCPKCGESFKTSIIKEIK
jgi:hypothetical protein